MSDQTTTSPVVESLLAERQSRIDAYTAELELLEAAKAKNDKKARDSHGGKMANRSKEIRDIEADLACEGHEVEPWTKPSNARSRLTELSQEQIENDLVSVYTTFSNARFESTKHTLDLRIQGLLKAAEKRSYKVQDPRKAKKSA